MKRFKKHLVLVLAASVPVLFCLSSVVFPHCEIPCGIYGDAMRLEMMAEHITTIEKAMNQINELSKDEGKNYNQIVRWIINKENHADYLSDIVTQYFMKQRITPVDNSEGQAYQDYVHRLTLLHKLMVCSMKCKQTTDLSNVTKLKEYLEQFKSAYSGSSSSTSGHGPESDQKH
jgi:nickel superoxide dismutase